MLQPLHAASFNTGELIIESGSKSSLAADEAYLFLSFNSDTNISRLTIDGEGLGNKIRFDDVKRGDNRALIKLKAGRYHWEHINIYFGAGSIRKKLDKDDYSFTVKPGVVNYPGSWSFRGEWVGNLRAKMSLVGYNNLTFEMEHFKAEYQSLVDVVPFEYQGAIKDPYPAFLTQALAQRDPDLPTPNLYYSKHKPAELPMTLLSKTTTTISADKKFPDIREYFQYDRQLISSVSPNQSWMLFSAIIDDVISIGVIGVKDFKTFVFYRQKLPSKTTVSELTWIDDDSFFFTLSLKDVDRSYVAHLTFSEQQNTINAKFINFRSEGYLLSGLRQQENQLFFVREMAAGSRQNNGLYQVDVSDERSIDQSFKKINKNTKKLKNVADWLVDKAGTVRGAVTVAYDKKNEQTILDYWYLPDAESNDWKKIKTVVGNDGVFWLAALSTDEQYFLVLTNEFSDNYAIHKFATADGAHLGVFYENSEHDISNVLLSSSGDQVIGYTYFENGLLKAHYLTELGEQFSQVQKSNPQLQLFQVQEMNRFNRMLLFGFTPQSQGAWFFLNTETGAVDKIFDFSPSYEQLPKGQHHVLKTQAEDGVELEGFLVMPELTGQNQAPLIVMPHGGPIGVRDYAHNSEMQHFLAAQGFATLKVNYRGSGGYGKAFEALGKGQWGEKIEQDIDTMTQYAVKKYPVDGSKICAMGGSYGGYSAVMLTYLYPQTYRCAVSFAGVMDLPLLFTSKDLSNDPELQKVMTDIVGDPVNEIQKLINKSPLYLLQDMQRPLLLFQGVEDTQVRVEQVLRMQQLISVYGLEHQVVLFEDEGHAFTEDNTVLLYLERSLKFIKEQLKLN